MGLPNLKKNRYADTYGWMASMKLPLPVPSDSGCIISA